MKIPKDTIRVFFRYMGMAPQGLGFQQSDYPMTIGKYFYFPLSIDEFQGNEIVTLR